MTDLQQRIQALASGDVAQFCGFISQLMCADSQQRGDAEKLLEALKEHIPDAFTAKFVEAMRQAPAPEIRGFAATILRKVLTKGTPPVWANVSEKMQVAIKGELLVAIKEEQERTVANKIADLMSEMVNKVLGLDDWPEVMPVLMQGIQSNQGSFMEASLLMLADIATVVMEAMESEMNNFFQLFLNCLAQGTPAIRLAGIKATTAFMVDVDDASSCGKYNSLIPAMISAIDAIFVEAGEAAAIEAYSTLIEVMEECPGFWTPELQGVVTEMLKRTQAEGVTTDMRTIIVELLLALIDGCKSIESGEPIIKAVTPDVTKVVMDFMLDIEDDPLWHKDEDGTNEEEGHGGCYDAAVTAIDRIALAVGGEVFLPIVAMFLPTWAADADWKKRHAALLVVAQMSEGCCEAMSKEVGPMLEICFRGLVDSHAKVRWAACQAIGLMVAALEDSIQKDHYMKIMGGLVPLVKDKANHRVQENALRALMDVLSAFDADIDSAELDTIVWEVLAAMVGESVSVRKVAVLFLGKIASEMEAPDFGKYYSEAMAALKTVLTKPAGSSAATFYAQVLDVMSSVGEASGKQAFGADWKLVIDYVKKVGGMVDGLEKDDTERKEVITYLLNTLESTCRTIGKDFAECMGDFAKIVTECLQDKPVLKCCDADEVDEEELENQEAIELGGKFFMIDRAAVECCLAGLTATIAFAETLEELFVPHMMPIMEAAHPLLQHTLGHQIRMYAIDAQPAFLNCAAQAVKKGSGMTVDFVAGMLSMQWPDLLKQLVKVDQSVVLQSMPNVLDALGKIITIMEGNVDEHMVEEAFAKTYAVLEAFDKTRAERAQLDDQFKEAAMDEEEQNEYEEELENEVDLYDKLENFLGAFLKSTGNRGLPLVEKLLPKLTPLLTSETRPEIRQMAAIVVTDICDYSTDGAAKYGQDIMPIFLEGCAHDHPGLRQCCAFGIGIMAQKVPQVFRPRAQEAVQQLMNTINHAGARSDDYQAATDNAISALGKIFELHSDAVDAKSIIDAWLNHLPLKADRVEAVIVHEQLLRLVENRDARVLGESNQNVQRVVPVMMGVLGGGGKLVTKDVGVRMVEILKQLQGGVPKEFVDKVFENMTPKEKDNLKAFMSNCV